MKTVLLCILLLSVVSLILWSLQISRKLWKKLLNPEIEKLKIYVLLRHSESKIFRDIIRIGKENRHMLWEFINNIDKDYLIQKHKFAIGVIKIANLLEISNKRNKEFFEKLDSEGMSLDEEWNSLTRQEFDAIIKEFTFAYRSGVDYLSYYYWSRSLGIDVTRIHRYLFIAECKKLYEAVKNEAEHLEDGDYDIYNQIRNDASHLWRQTWTEWD